MSYQIVREFEDKVAKFAGSKYGVAVESGTAAIFLSLMYRKYVYNKHASTFFDIFDVEIPKFTYPSVPCSIIHAGGTVKFSNEAWKGVYELKPTGIIDGALRFKRGMYNGGLHCLSFHVKKLLPIGRGGMILTNSEEAYKWLKKARFDGRDECDLSEDNLTMLGWNMYMSPEQAVRGIMLMNPMPKDGFNDLDSTKQNYPDLSKCAVYNQSLTKVK